MYANVLSCLKMRVRTHFCNLRHTDRCQYKLLVVELHMVPHCYLPKQYLQSRECWAIQFVYIVFFLGWLHYFLVCTSYFVVVSFLQMFYVRQEKSKKTLRPVFPIKAHSPLMNVLHSHLMQETDIFFCVISAAVALFVVTTATTIYLDLKV